MKSSRFHPLILILALAALMLGACGGRDGAATPSSQGQPALEPTASQLADPYLVASLGEVKQAVIQIESQGTFVDPDFQEYSSAGRGSGFLIDPSGLAITNNHVVTGAALINVWIGGDTSTTYNAKILAVSECSDLALIDIEGQGFNYLTWYPDPIRANLEVYAAGYPLGDSEYTLTKGIISKQNAGGESSWSSVSQVLEHNAALNPGSSGGPLITQSGQLVGINYAADDYTNLYYAIGRDAAQPVIDQLIAGDDVDSLGINGGAIISEDGAISGVWVYSVQSGSPADLAGLASGDLITSLEGLPLGTDGTMRTYCDILRTQGDQHTLGMEVMRFETNQLLEGQFNGRPLAVSGSLDGIEFSASGGDYPEAENQNIVETLDDGYMTIRDDSASLYLDVPLSWNQTDGSIWSDFWGDLAFEAQDITAAPDLNEYIGAFDKPGVSFSASRDWGNIGGYIMLLDGVKHWFTDSCTFQERESYQDPIYEGALDTWQCGPEASLYVVGARPIENPTEYLVLITIQVPSDDTLTRDRILDTFIAYDEDLP